MKKITSSHKSGQRFGPLAKKLLDSVRTEEAHLSELLESLRTRDFEKAVSLAHIIEQERSASIKS